MVNKYVWSIANIYLNKFSKNPVQLGSQGPSVKNCDFPPIKK